MPKRFVRFALVGVGSTALHVAVAWILIAGRDLSPAVANGAAFLAATLFSCVLNTRWTFGAEWSKTGVARFLTVTSAMLMLSMGLARAVDMMGLAPSIGILVIVSVVPIITFALHRTWTYDANINGERTEFYINRQFLEISRQHVTTAEKYLSTLGGRWATWAIILIILAWHAIFFLPGYRLTADDVSLLKFWILGPDALWDFTVGVAQGQGRIGFYLLMPLNALASYLAGSLASRAVMIALYMLIPLLFAVFCARLLKANIALLILLVWVSFHPLAFEHMPPTAYPLQNSVPMLIILVCRIAQIDIGESPAKRGVWKLAANRFLVALAMLTTEYAALFGLALIGAEWLARMARFDDWKRPTNNLRKFLFDHRTLADYFAIFIFVVPYGAFRIAFPSEYDGNTLDGLFNWRALAETTIRHIIDGTIFGRMDDLNAREVPAWGTVMSIISGFLLAIAVRRSLPAAGEAFPSFSATAYALLAAIFITLPVTASVKQQTWCVEFGTCGFLDSRISVLGIALVIALGVAKVISRGKTESSRRLRSMVMSASLGGLFFVTSLHNWTVMKEMHETGQVWARANSISCVYQTQAFQSDAIQAIVDPEGKVPFHPTDNVQSFWESYIAFVPSVWADCANALDLYDVEGVSFPLFVGWSRSESTHRWSEGSESQIILSLPPENSLREVCLAVHGFTLGEQTISVTVDGARAIEQRMTGEGVLQIPLGDAEGIVTVDFSFSDPRQPGNGDPRILAFAVRSLTVDECH